MKTKMIATAAILSITTGFVAAQTTADKPAMDNKPATAAKSGAPDAIVVITPVTRADRRARTATVMGEKDKLEQMLRTAQKRSDYADMLQKAGYKISAINADEKDYLEYEIVKGNTSYEVQLDFNDNPTGKATEVDVTTNMWRADSTERMMADAAYVPPAPLVADPQRRYSDRQYMKGWTSEKDQLEKMRTPNMTADQFMAKIKDRGYQVTSTNDRERDYLEYEIVKGDNSYEVQMDIDPQTKVIREVDVAANLWDAPMTDRAKNMDKKLMKN